MHKKIQGATSACTVQTYPETPIFTNGLNSRLWSHLTGNSASEMIRFPDEMALTVILNNERHQKAPSRRSDIGS